MLSSKSNSTAVIVRATIAGVPIGLLYADIGNAYICVRRIEPKGVQEL